MRVSEEIYHLEQEWKRIMFGLHGVSWFDSLSISIDFNTLWYKADLTLNYCPFDSLLKLLFLLSVCWFRATLSYLCFFSGRTNLNVTMEAHTWNPRHQKLDMSLKKKSIRFILNYWSWLNILWLLEYMWFQYLVIFEATYIFFARNLTFYFSKLRDSFISKVDGS